MNYHVVAFAHDDKERALEFYEKGRAAIRASIERFRQKSLAEPSMKEALKQSLSHVEIFVWTPPPIETKPRWKEMNLDVELLTPYDKYSRVYFLNDAALRMYKSEDIKFEVLESISPDTLARIPASPLTGPYLR